MPSKQFSHIPFAGVVEDTAYTKKPPQPPQKQRELEENRQQHYDDLSGKLGIWNAYWADQKKDRESRGLPVPEGTALWVKVDEKTANLDFLKTTFGLELVSEEDDGFILVSADENAYLMTAEKLERFLKSERGGGGAAKIYDIADKEDLQERLNRILPPAYLDRWHTIQDVAQITADFCISCNAIKIPEIRQPKQNETEDDYNAYFERASARVTEKQIELDDLMWQRQGEFQNNWISQYGSVESCVEGFTDSFTVRATISGAGFRDIVVNYSFLFQVEDIEIIDTAVLGESAEDWDDNIEIVPPDADAPTVCVIDSGIQENHRLIEPAIVKEHSFNFIPDDPNDDVADYVKQYGHGTSVAGAILYSEIIPESGAIKLLCRIQNARILNADGGMPKNLLPASYIHQVVEHYNNNYGTRLFNHSINSSVPYRTPHMSTWAAAMDKLSYLYDVMIIQSAGNLQIDSNEPTFFGIKNHIEAGRDYPDYLNEPSCRISNPAQSFQALTVGSISRSEFDTPYLKALAGNERISPFSRSGKGIWDSIKPEVVELGGDLVVSPDSESLLRVSTHTETSPWLVQSTYHGAPAAGRNEVGTSYSAPRVSALAAKLLQEWPNETTLLYRALIANCARWPAWADNLTDPAEKLNVLKQMGYGIPDGERALRNDDYRATLIVSNEPLHSGMAKMFEVPIPESLRAVTAEYDVRIDITLSYTAMPRRTRRGFKQYLSTRLSWKCSCAGESKEKFKSDLFKEDEAVPDEERIYFDWKLRGADNHGQIKGARRDTGTLQKDWAYVKGRDLPDSFLVGVIGHKGWDHSQQYPARFALAVSFEIVNQEIPIYAEIKAAIDELRVEIEPVQVSVDSSAGQMGFGF